MPGLAGPEQSLAHATLEDAEPVGQGGVCAEYVTELVEFAPRNARFDIHILWGVIRKGKGPTQDFDALGIGVCARELMGTGRVGG